MSDERSGVGLFALLGVLFIGLKLGGVIGWSWWWVLAPFWVPPVGVFSVLVVCWLLFDKR